MSTKFLAGTTAELESDLEDLNRKMEEEETQAKAASLGLPYVDLHNFPVDLSVLGLFTESEAKNFGAVPFYKELADLRIGATDPEHPELKDKLKELGKKNHVSLYLISRKSFLQTLRFYSKVVRPKAALDDTVRIQDQPDYQKELALLKDEGAQKTKTGSELIAMILGAAVYYKASDIHLEPESHFLKLRFRIDGVLQDMLHLSSEFQRPLFNRIKILSKLKTNLENVPQDGRLTFYYLSKPIDVRVSTLPSAYGEEAVLRLLGNEATGLKLADLGLSEQAREILERHLLKPNGMVITTGPTGSGKTTTLYAFLNQLNQPGVKIITLEDPVEYKLEGIVQTPIDHMYDFDFAKGLRAILRQDPDIVMVGEIRDQETAEVGMQAALTGHLVFSTLHTNDAAGAVPRLLNMGVKPFVIAPALSAVIAQRLVRRLCPYCKVPAKLSPTVLEKISLLLKYLPKQIPLPKAADLQFFHGAGCEKCHGLGYSGRIGIYEVLENTEAVQKLILAQTPSMASFKKAALEQGMITMVQDGILKALTGITDVEEVFRVAGEN